MHDSTMLAKLVPELSYGCDVLNRDAIVFGHKMSDWWPKSDTIVSLLFHSANIALCANNAAAWIIGDPSLALVLYSKSTEEDRWRKEELKNACLGAFSIYFGGARRYTKIHAQFIMWCRGIGLICLLPKLGQVDAVLGANWLINGVLSTVDLILMIVQPVFGITYT